MAPPPGGTVEGPENGALLHMRRELRGWIIVELAHEARDDDADLAAAANDRGEPAQVQVVRPEVVVGVGADDDVEKLVGVRQRMSFGVDRKDRLFNAGVANAG